ncbi:hypothetical protein [Variovorax ginsengisoli]|uniref:Lysozyme n=1 Tax=Variovorax ginsengisoli TaxID=363844 RepID=A0ABT9SE05_9BURK|nr:hypothetical protein [Variovorax ginsengisoli]MDP9902601.1 hypothetical protein [Variovorax ginsengisoli]
MNPLIMGLAIALAVSVAGNASIGWAWLGARDDLATATVERDNARSAATACSDATEDLRELADKRGAEAKVAQAAARRAAKAKGDRANLILTTPPALRGDDCGSARVRIDDWLSGRTTP